ncbi:AMP-binding protein [Aliihoeflea sp. 40Bstr573]|uniref:AMP-binding protein n=1 Tax=Aliihoeflea sp. 40Bstr573 TaxID=2696467 RepID=UPI0020957821|nr:AMP-binding protein [Aliihoeflea sp. 40Bstr573]MCO6388728.1 AMP-binding protein [Aliihoeflea sp. 40Bstr573]
MVHRQNDPIDYPDTSVAALFERTAARLPDHPFVAVRRGGVGEFTEVTYRDFLSDVLAARQAYRAAGYGVGTRAAILIGNEPAFHLHYLALNGLGVSIVPLNADARPSEMLYLIEHSEATFVTSSRRCRPILDEVLAGTSLSIPVFDADDLPAQLPPASRAAGRQQAGRDDEAAILYTSGTTGRPKGCVLSNRYFLEAAGLYASWGGGLSLREETERLLNPLPLFHMNNLAVTTTAMIAKGGCNVMVERFSPSSWWADCRDSKATLVHYLGVMPALLLARPVEEVERQHTVRAGIGAGVDPKHHSAFEARFGFPLLELWGMTEVGAGFIDNHEPRQMGTRAFGRPDSLLKARIVDENMNDVQPGTPGELLVQSGDPNPRRGFFSGYLKDGKATEAAWHEDWFRTGDVVRQDETGMLYFVDRRKNIVRRSGENIAAAEVEACLQAHPEVVQAAVIAMPDALREEEVFACVVLRDGVAQDLATARRLFDWVFDHLVYFKAPGYVSFRHALPTTGTQKIQKGLIFGDGEDPLALPTTFDLRELKRRTRTGSDTAASGTEHMR